MIGAIAFVLNLPWTIVALMIAFLQIPRNFSFNRHPFALIIKVQSTWIYEYLFRAKGSRAAVMGAVVILGPKLEKNDLQHELVHVEQYVRAPLIHPFLTAYETRRNGYQNNKYEIEAYHRAGNPYKEADGTFKYYK